MHTSFTGTWHIPIGIVGAGIYGGFRQCGIVKICAVRNPQKSEFQ